MINELNSPVLDSSKVPPMADGSPETILMKIIIDIPFNTPLTNLFAQPH